MNTLRELLDRRQDYYNRKVELAFNDYKQNTNQALEESLRLRCNALCEKANQAEILNDMYQDAELTADQEEMLLAGVFDFVELGIEY